MDIFLDNGILKNILKKSNLTIATKFKEEFSHRIVRESQKISHHYISAPIMVIEYIGIKLAPIFERFPEIKAIAREHAQKGAFNADKFGTRLREVFEEKISREDISNYDFLIAKIKAEEKFRDPFGIELASMLYLDNLKDPNTRYRYIAELSLDEIQGLDFSEFFETDVTSKLGALLTSFGRSLMDPSLNVTFARILHQWYLSLDSEPQVREQARRCQYDFDSSHQDRLDTLLVHFACFGNKRDGSIKRVCCVTTEQPERIINRCKVYLSFIARFQKIIKDLDGRLIEPKPGKVLFIKQSTGEVATEFDLQDTWLEVLEIRDRTPG